ncbi:phytoene desaturase family protein [Corynebacterium ulceribovis]|uniref:phytoene desaturase family protein n=1 Tax=Corynebacterium ulceribovis TaxID=487732 RepID=UPI000365D328|nr:phytoene desaturase family protein [Corynebacterium ulceribovis]
MSLRRQVPYPTGTVVVIGAGLSGLTAAVRLLATGHHVTVVDRGSQVGGRCQTELLATTCRTAGGSDTGMPHIKARFDTGATVLTLPTLLESTLASAGLRIDDVDPDFELRRISPTYYAEFAGGHHSGDHIDVMADPHRMAEEIARFTTSRNGDGPAAARRYLALRKWLKQMYSTAFPFMNSDFDKLSDMWQTTALKSGMGELLQLGGLSSLERQIGRFIKDPDLARVFSFQSLYAGVSPHDARAVYAMIAHMDTSMGVYYPTVSATGPGMGAIPGLLAAAVKKLGGEVLLEHTVTGLDTVGNRVAAVHTDQGSLPCDAVVSTVDLPLVDRWLDAGGFTPPHRRAGYRWSPSAVVVHGTLPTAVTSTWAKPLRHHTISFGAKWSETFQEIAAPKNAQLMSDPSLLVTRPAATNPEFIVTGPDGETHEPISFLAPCPNLESAALHWSTLTGPYVADLAKVLEIRGFSDMSELSIARIDTPATWAQAGMGAGSPFALAHTVTQTGPFRPRNMHPKRPENLVLAGATTTPGIGVPTVMMSGAHAAARFEPLPKD